jgi:hypothetical protein
MYIKLNNGAIEKYPYSIGELRKDNPNTSFPKNPGAELLAEWEVYWVSDTPMPQVDYTKDVAEGTPVSTSDGWVQVWVVTDASPEEIESRTQSQSQSVRTDRDEKLSACDWVVIKATETEVPEIEAWKAYRQALRDIPQQSGFPWNVVWPQQPQ